MSATVAAATASQEAELQRCAPTGNAAEPLPLRAALQADGGVSARSGTGASSSASGDSQPQPCRAAHSNMVIIDLTAEDDDASADLVEGQRQAQGAKLPAQDSTPATVGAAGAADARGVKRKHEPGAKPSHGLGVAGPSSAAPDQAPATGEQQRSKRLRATAPAGMRAAGGAGMHHTWLPLTQVAGPDWHCWPSSCRTLLQEVAGACCMHASSAAVCLKLGLWGCSLRG